MPHPCGSPHPSLPDPAPRLLPRLDRRLWEGWEGQDRLPGKLPPHSLARRLRAGPRCSTPHALQR